MLIKIISLLALLASVAWFATQPSWESGAAGLGTLADFLLSYSQTLLQHKQKLKRFHVTVEKFLRSTGANTSPLNVGIQSLNPYLRTNDPVAYKKIVKELNSLADEFASQHADFAMTARRKFRV